MCIAHSLFKPKRRHTLSLAWSSIYAVRDTMMADGREGPPLYWAKAQGEDAKLRCEVVKIRCDFFKREAKRRSYDAKSRSYDAKSRSYDAKFK